MLGAPKLHSSDDIDATVELTAPDGRSCRLLLEAKARLAPKQVRPLLYVTAEARERAPLIVVARYLSEGTRQRLRDGGVGYLDLTGNIQIAVSEPGLYIETSRRKSRAKILIAKSARRGRCAAARAAASCGC
jgi:hypothetical protein